MQRNALTMPFACGFIKTFMFLASILFSTLMFSQKRFSMLSTVGTVTVSVNGKKYVVDSTGIKIKTRFQKLDTLTFITDYYASDETKILCNFKPDSSYCITFACCGSLDIVPESRFHCDSLKYWDYEKDFDKIQKQFLDMPFLSIKTKRAPRDSIYAWHSDAACITEHKLLSTELWRLGVPPKCFYWSNITAILFFKTDAKSKQPKNDDVGAFVEKKNVVELSTIYLRLFDNQRFILSFDEEHHSVDVSYE